MRKIAILSVLGLLALVVPAQAANYAPAPPKLNCTPHKVGYKATGSLISAALTSKGSHRYDGTLVVDVKRANHRAPTGEQTFALVNAKVFFHHGVNAAEPEASSRVKLTGTITAIPRGCPTGSFTPVITVKKVDISKARTHRRHHRATS